MDGNWIISAASARLVSSLTLILIYLYCYLRFRDSHLKWWTWAWVLYTARFLFFMAGAIYGRHPALTLMEDMCVLTSTMALFQGALLVRSKPFPRWWIAAGVLVAFWCALPLYKPVARLALTLPLYLYLGTLQIWTGLIFLRLRDTAGFGWRLTGWSMIAWGLHKFDYPFLSQAPWFSPWGFIIASLLGTFAGLGLLLWYFEQTGRRLGQSEIRFSELFNAAPVGIFVFDEYRGIQAANERAGALLGYRPEEMRGLRPEEFIHPEDLSALPVRAVTSPLAAGESSRLLRRYKHKDGHHLIVEVDVLRTGDDNRLLVIFQDVTDRIVTSKALEESEERYRQLFEKMQSGFVLLKGIPGDGGGPWDFRFIEMNPAFERHTGLKVDDVQGRTIREVLPDIEEHWIERYTQVALTAEPAQFESHNASLDKHFNVVAYNSAPMLVAVIFSDITAVTLARRTLEESEQRFRTLVENLPGAVYRYCDDRTVNYMSDNVMDITGLPASEFLGSGMGIYTGLMHPEDRDIILRAMRHAIENREVYALEYRILHSDGSIRWIHEKGRGVFGPDGSLTYLDGLLLDVTERMTAENALRKALAFNQMILRHTPVSVSVFDGRTRQCLMANDVLANILGDRLEQATPASIRELDSWREASLLELAEKALQGMGMHRKDVRIKMPGGQAVFLDCMFVRFDVDGKPYLMRVATDITDRVRMEEVMIQTEKMMSVGGLAAGMAHEINNPLGGILQGVQVMKLRLTADNIPNQSAASTSGLTMDQLRAYMEKREVYSMLEHVRLSATRAARIVSGMLEFARQTDHGRVSEDVRDMLDKAVEFCSSDYDLKKKYDFRHIIIERDFEPDLPEVECSRTQIEQVFMNILRNSAQAMHGYTRDGQPPKIILRAVREESSVRIELEDNGPGMDEDTRRRIFEPFYTTKQPGDGTGLGLSVSYFIVTSNHGGSIETVSEPGKGATFVIRLPLTNVPTD